MTDEQPYESPWTPPPLNHHASGSATAEYPIVPTGSAAFPPDLPDDARGASSDEPDGQTPDRFAGHAGYFGSPAQPGYMTHDDSAPLTGREVRPGADEPGGPRSGGRHLQPEPEPVSMFSARIGIGQRAIDASPGDASPGDEQPTNILRDPPMPDARAYGARAADLVPADARRGRRAPDRTRRHPRATRQRVTDRR